MFKSFPTFEFLFAIDKQAGQVLKKTITSQFDPLTRPSQPIEICPFFTQHILLSFLTFEMFEPFDFCELSMTIIDLLSLANPKCN